MTQGGGVFSKMSRDIFFGKNDFFTVFEDISGLQDVKNNLARHIGGLKKAYYLKDS